jgi:hypothetical protein
VINDSNKLFLDSGEGFIAHFSLLPFLQQKQQAKLTKIAISSIASLEKNLKNSMHEYLTTPKFKKLDLNFSKVSFDEAQAAVSKMLDAEELATSIPQIESVELASKLIDVVIRAHTRLQSVLPKKPARSGFKPGDFIAADFLRQFRTINDPMTVIRDMEMGCLSTSQVLVLKDVYPELYRVMSETMIETVVELTADDANFTIPYAKLKQSAILLQNPLAPEDLQALLQSNFNKPRDEKKSSGKEVDLPASNPTQQQKMEQK